MAKSRGLGAWLEEKAEGPAYAIVFVCMASRAASYYSAGAFVIAHLIGQVGLSIYNIVTGLGVAVGSGLVVSVAGRQWRRALAELAEIDGLKGLSKAERAAKKKQLAAEARKQFVCMAVALTAETAAAFFFFWTGGGAHDAGAFFGDTVISGTAVFIAFYFGVMKDQKAQDQKAANQLIAYEHRAKAQKEAWARIANGEGTPADVYFVAQDLPKAERASTIAALLPRDGDDPTWQIPQLMEWLGTTDASVKRGLYRKLDKLGDAVASVVKDPASGWQLPRSVAWKYFMPLFIQLHGGPASDTSATRVRHAPRKQPMIPAVDATETRQGQDMDASPTREEEPVVALS